MNKIEVEQTENGFIFRVKGKVLVSGLKAQAITAVFNQCIKILREEEKETNKKIEIKKGET